MTTESVGTGGLSGRVDVVIGAGPDQLAAWFYPAHGDTPAPCVVMAHGFTGVRDMHLDASARGFVAAGYNALVFDYRHFGDSGGQPRQLLDLKKQYEDWDRAIAFAQTHRTVDSNALVLWGTSFSGGHVIDAAVRHGDVAAVIAQAPFVDGLAMSLSLVRRYPRVVPRLQAAAIADQIRAWLKRSPRYIPVACPPGGFGALPAPHVWHSIPVVVPAGSTWRNEVAARFALRIALQRPIRRASKVSCPVLVQLLEDETVLPVKPVRRVARLAPNGELLTYPSLDHFDIYVGKPHQLLLADQLHFLNRVLTTNR